MEREVEGSLTEIEMASNEEKVNWSNGLIAMDQLENFANILRKSGVFCALGDVFF